MSATTFYYSDGSISTSSDATLNNTSYLVPIGYELVRVDVGTSCTSLDNFCFLDCSALTSITLPSSVTSLGTSCFLNCSKLTSITIPSTVTSLGDYCFRGTILSAFTMDNQNNLTSCGTNLFFNVTTLSSATFYLTQNYNALGPTAKNTLYPQISDKTSNITYDANPSCFNEGTKILTYNGYIAIENLRSGELVKTYKHGYRKIDLIGKGPMVNNPDVWHASMYKMEKTDENGLVEDLIVTGGHAVLTDTLEDEYVALTKGRFGTILKIDDKYLLLASLSKDFKQIKTNDFYTYYHLCLENNGDDDERFGIWANGVLTETPSKKQFIGHNYQLL